MNQKDKNDNFCEAKYSGKCTDWHSEPEPPGFYHSVKNAGIPDDKS